MTENPPTRVDDENLSDDEILWRRILAKPEWVENNRDGSGSIRPSSIAFLDNRTKEVSVNVASLTTKEEVLAPYPNQGLVSIPAGLPRSHGLIIALTPEVPEPSHRVICPRPVTQDGPVISGNKRKTVARKLAESAKWLVYPEGYKHLDL